MGITIDFGEGPVVKLTKPQERALRTTLEIVEAISTHVEKDEDVETPGKAATLIRFGLPHFVETYAPEEKTDDQPGSTVGDAGGREA
jgi:hypothetical protein